MEPVYKAAHETRLKDYYTFVGAGFYPAPTQENPDGIIFKWDNEEAWKAILYRHLYTTDQRNQLYEYVHLAKHINDAVPGVRNNIKDGQFQIGDTMYCVRNMYIYTYDIVAGCLLVCAQHFKKNHTTDTINVAIVVLCDNGGHTCRDILTIIQYATTYKILHVSSEESHEEFVYVYKIDDIEYIFPAEYQYFPTILKTYFNISPIMVASRPIHVESEAQKYVSNYHGIANPTGTCTAISLLYMLSDMDILVQECDAYNEDGDSMMYMFKTFQEFRRDSVRLHTTHRNYGKLYHAIDRFLSEEWTLLRWFSPSRPYEPKKVMEAALDLPTRSCWGTTQIPIIKLIDGLVANLKHPMNMIFADCGNTKCKTRPFIYDIYPGKELEWLDRIDTSHKYVILRRAINPAWYMWFTCFNAANIPIRVYNKHTDSDYVLVSYLMHIPRRVFWHMVYVNMETRTRVCAASMYNVADNGPSAMYTYTTDAIGWFVQLNEPEYTPQALAHACMLLYRLDDGPSQVVVH